MTLGMRKSSVRAAAAVLPLIGFAPGPLIVAAETGVEDELIEEIVVTARKRAEPLQDVPGSAAALSGRFIEDVGGISNLRELTDQITGLTIREAQDGSQTEEPSIRGAGQARNRASVSATGLYRNDAYFATPAFRGRNFARFDLYDVQRVEVLRGPQGALYGRNALGGAINVISRKPQDEWELEAELAAGENESLRYGLKVNVPINDALAFRMSHVREDQDDGFYTDINGDPVDTSEYRHTRVSLGFDAELPWSVYYSYDTEDEDTHNSILVNERVLSQLDSEFDTLINSPHVVDAEVDNHNLLFDYEVDVGTFSWISNYRSREVAEQSDGDYLFGPNIAFSTRDRRTLETVDSEIFFQELRYVADGTDRFNWLLGIDYFTHDTTEVIDQLIPQGSPLPNDQFRNLDLNQDSWAVFAAAEYNFDSLPVAISGEIRYAVDEIGGSVLQFRRRFGDVPTTDFDETEKYTNVPWTATLSYRLGDRVPLFDDAMTYVKVASSYRHGGLNLDSGNSELDRFPVPLLYEEESSLTYEVGFKSTLLDRRLTFNAAAFLTDYEDFLDTTTNGCPAECTLVDVMGNPLGFDDQGNRIEADAMGRPGIELPQAFFVANVGEVEAWGIELELNYRMRVEATGGFLNLRAGWARQLGKVVELRDNVSAAVLEAEDARLNAMRPKQVNAALIYRQPVSFLQAIPGFDGATLLTSVNYTWEEGGFQTLSSVSPIELEEVKRLNARLGLETNRWSLIARGTNITDYRYQPWQFPGIFFVRNQPEFYEVEFKWRIR